MMGYRILIWMSLIVFASGSSAFASAHLECDVVMLNMDSSNPEIIRKQKVREIASFQVDNPGEEERIDRFFRLPKTNWLIVASIYATDESMSSKAGADSLDLELSLARKRVRNILNTPAYASAEMPYGAMDVARVSMMVRQGKHKQLVVMQCIEKD